MIKYSSILNKISNDPKSINILLIVLLILASFFNYSSTLKGDFLVDDYSFLSGVDQFYFQTFKDYFILTQDQHYSPIYYLISVNLFKLFPDNPFVLRLISLILFCISCIVLYFLVLCLTKSRIISSLTSLLFCLHPIHHDIVVHISSNFIFIYAIFLELSLIFYLKSYENKNKNLYYVISLILYILSLLTFEGALLLPIYIILIHIMIKRVPLKNFYNKLRPILIISFIYLLLWINLAGPRSNLLEKILSLNLTIGSYFASIATLISWYLVNLINPKNVVMIHNILPIHKDIASINVSLIFVIVYMIYFIIKNSKKNIIGFSVVWVLIGFTILFAATFSHSYMGLVIEPHWFYFSSIGFFMFLAQGLKSLKEKINVKIWCALILCFFTYYYLSNQEYNSNSLSQEKYNKNWLKKSPNNVIPMLNLAKIYSDSGNSKDAADIYYKILTISDYQEDVIYNALAIININTGNLVLAKKYLEKAITINSFNSNIYGTNASIALFEKDYKKAITNLERVFDLAPYSFEAGMTLLELYHKQNDELKEIYILERLLKIPMKNADKVTLKSKLAALYFRQGKADKTLDIIQNIIKSNSRPEVIMEIASELYLHGANNLAKKILDLCIKIYPDYKEAYLLGGVIRANQGKLQDAINIWNIGLEYDRRDKRFIENIKRAKNLLK